MCSRMTEHTMTGSVNTVSFCAPMEKQRQQSDAQLRRHRNCGKKKGRKSHAKSHSRRDRDQSFSRTQHKRVEHQSQKGCGKPHRPREHDLKARVEVKNKYSMVRTKSTKRKVILDSPRNSAASGYSNNDTSDKYLHEPDEWHHTQGLASNRVNSSFMGKLDASSGKQAAGSKGKDKITSVMIKEEPVTECDETCLGTVSAHVLERGQTPPSHSLRVKQEPKLAETAPGSRSCASPLGGVAAMDLGSHLEHSLSNPNTSGLTWSQLMEPKNFPRVQETPTSQDVVVKKEKVDPELDISGSKRSKELDFQGQSFSSGVHSENTGQPATTSGNGGTVALSTSSNTKRVSPALGLLSSSSRFSSSGGNGGKAPLNERSSAGSFLDLSKRTIPPEIRRVLASKYGLSRRNDDGHVATVVPNFHKSRSRFTMAVGKSPGLGQDSESGDKIETSASPLSTSSDHENPTSKDQPASSQPSKQFSPSPDLNHSASSSEPPSSVESRQLSSGVESREPNPPRSTYLTLDHRPVQKKTDNLKSHGLLDLGSHYGDLLKDSSPPVPPKSSSQSSPGLDSARSPRPNNPGEAMIELGGVGRSRDGRSSATRRTEQAMIDLSSMDAPKSPRSPSFRSITFPNVFSQNYRPGHNFQPRPSTGFPPRPRVPHGFGPRPAFATTLHQPHCPEYRNPNSEPMIDLGSFGKSQKFQGASSTLPSEVVSRSVFGSKGGPRVIPKRRHSLDSQSLSLSGKRQRTTLDEQNERSKMRKTESGVRLNVADLLQLEQEEQRYIKDLSGVQSQVTDLRFKIQGMQRELEKLQNSETDIKQRIDVVRAKRVMILKEAQDREGSEGSARQASVKEVSRGEERMQPHLDGRHGESDFVHSGFSGKSFSRASPNLLTTRHAEDLNGSKRSKDTQPEADLADEIRIEEEDVDASGLRWGSISGKMNEEILNHSTGSYYGENRDHVASERLLHSSHTSGYGSSLHSHSSPRYQLAPSSRSSAVRNDHKRKYSEKFVHSDSSVFQRALQEKDAGNYRKHSASYDGDVVEVGDGTLLAGQNRISRRRHSRKDSSSVIVEEIDVDCGLRNESKQFLGCLEISSTTDEIFTNDDSSPKEVLAEKERASMATKHRSDQERISSTVSTPEVKQADAAIESLSEMEFIGHSDAVGFVFANHGRLFSASADRTAKVFDLKTGDCLKTFQGHQQSVNCLQVMNDGGGKERLFTGSNDQTVRAYNVKSGVCTHKYNFRGRVMCLHIAFGKLFVGLSSGFVAVVDLKANQCIDQFNCHEPSRISCIASATEGQRGLLCTGSFDATIAIRDQKSGLLQRTIGDHKLTVLCMQVVENILYSGSADTVVQSHNINTGELVRSYTGHTMSVSGLQALGGVLVTSSLDRIIRCFDIKTGDLLQLYGGNTDMIFSLSLFSDMIYTGCRDGKLSGVRLDLRKYHCCRWGKCSLKFGLLSHLKQHIQDHVNQTIVFDSCLWEGCFHKFPRGKQLEVNQAAMEHITNHVPGEEN